MASTNDRVGEFINSYGAVIALAVILGMGVIGTYEVANTFSVTSSGNTTDSNETLFCAADVKECPDGSFVSRDPNNNCAFEACPTSTSDSMNETAEQPMQEPRRGLLVRGWCAVVEFFGGTCTL